MKKVFLQNINFFKGECLNIYKIMEETRGNLTKEFDIKKTNWRKYLNKNNYKTNLTAV